MRLRQDLLVALQPRVWTHDVALVHRWQRETFNVVISSARGHSITSPLFFFDELLFERVSEPRF